jgi:hypothetical protein
MKKNGFTTYLRSEAVCIRGFRVASLYHHFYKNIFLNIHKNFIFIMRKSQNTLAQLNENNFDILNNNGLGKIKGGYSNPTPCGNAYGLTKKSIKKIKVKSIKSLKSIKVRPTGCCTPCGCW